MDIDYRFDRRDGQYKLLDFNPRIGAQFRLFTDENGVDVTRALYRDLTGQAMQRALQVDGRVFVVEPYDLRTSVTYFRKGELSARAWLRSFNGRKEFAWFSWDDPLPALMAWARLAIQGVAKMIWIERFKSGNTGGERAGAAQERKPDQAVPIAQNGRPAQIPSQDRCGSIWDDHGRGPEITNAAHTSSAASGVLVGFK